MSKVIDGVLYLVRGDDESVTLTVTDESGDPVAFREGDIVTLTVRTSPCAAAVNLTVSETVTQATAGASFVLHIPRAVTGDAVTGEYSGDIQVHYAQPDMVRTVWPEYDADKKYITDANWKNVRIVGEVTVG